MQSTIVLQQSISAFSRKENNISEILQGKNFPSLNGLRGISIIMVVFEHLRLSQKWMYQSVFQGGLGVNIFFVLSGFLISTLCFKELEKTQTISLTKFYIRRALRIFPVAYLYILVIFLFSTIYKVHVSGIQFLGASVYLMDFSYFRSHHFTWYFGHFWSLSVEEQFYLIFPFLIKKNIKAFKLSITLLVFILPIFCTLQYFIPGFNKGTLYGFSHYFVKFQSISVGCLFAILANMKKLDTPLFSSYKNIGSILCLLLIFTLHYDPFYSLEAVYKNLCISLLTGFLIIFTLYRGSVLYSILNGKILSQIGILSYSIYIWQQIFTAAGESPVKFIVSPPFNILFIIIIPVLSYYFYEKYFLRIKNKYSIERAATTIG